LSLVSSSGEEAKTVSTPKPKPSEKPEGQPVKRRFLVGKLDLKALHQPQGPDSGINAIMGKWPGDETDEEILALLEEMS
jgi:hypothetical protein